MNNNNGTQYKFVLCMSNVLLHLIIVTNHICLETIDPQKNKDVEGFITTS